MGEIAGVRPASLFESVNLSRRLVSAVLLLAGLGLCLGSALGFTGALCLTEGCKLYQGYSFLGLSLHIWGAAAFGAGLLLLLCAVGRVSLYRRFLHLCLWAEIVLLAWQVVYLPCSECLLVGLVWGLLALVEFKDRRVFKVWSVVFLVALVLMGKGMLNPWPVYGSADAGVKVYFSPSCPSCREEIDKLLAGGEAGLDRVTFYPVALKSSDYERVEAFQNVLRLTLNLEQAFQACWTETVPAPSNLRDRLAVRLGLLRNRLVLARMGLSKVPVVVSGSAVSGLVASGECDLVAGEDCGDGLGPAARPDGLRGLRREGVKAKGKDRLSRGTGGSGLVLAQARAEETEPQAPVMRAPDLSPYFEDEETEPSFPVAGEAQDGGEEDMVDQGEAVPPEE
jgi:hypothetical protein